MCWLSLLTGVGALGEASQTPRWVFDLVRRFQPGSLLLKEPSLSRFGAARKSAKKGKAVVSAEVPSPVTPTTPLKGKDRGKAGEISGTPIRGATKRSADDASVAKGATSFKKKKKTKDTPEPPIRVDAKPRVGPVYDSEMYQTPLDWPMIYRRADEDWFMDVFERLRDVRIRVQHDYEVMRDNAIAKGWWTKEDCTTEEEEEGSVDGSSDSDDLLYQGK